jgi:hypothetical protein
MNPSLITLIKFSLLFIVLSLSFTFCKKQEAVVEEEPVAETPAPVTPQSITALKIDSTSTTVQIVQTGTAEGIFNSNFESRSIPFDVDNDGNNDVAITMYCLKSATGFGNWWHRVKTLRSDVNVLCDSIYSLTTFGNYYYAPLYANLDSLIVKANNYGDTLKTTGKWRNGSVLMYREVVMWDTINKPAHWAGAYYGPFSSWKYVGLKCGTKFAWLKIYSQAQCNNSVAFVKEVAISN